MSKCTANGGGRGGLNYAGITIILDSNRTIRSFFQMKFILNVFWGRGGWLTYADVIIKRGFAIYNKLLYRVCVNVITNAIFSNKIKNIPDIAFKYLIFVRRCFFALQQYRYHCGYAYWYGLHYIQH